MTESQISIFDDDTSTIQTQRSNVMRRFMAVEMKKTLNVTQKISTETTVNLNTENSPVSIK